MYYIKEQDVEGLQLPGRLWKKLVGPEDGDCQNMIFGVVIDMIVIVLNILVQMTKEIVIIASSEILGVNMTLIMITLK